MHTISSIPKRFLFSMVLIVISSISIASEQKKQFSAQQMADAIFSVIESDRTIYTSTVVNRLQNELEIIEAHEKWQQEQALPLPAQMLRMGAERVNENNSGFSYALLSTWPINPQNKPRTEQETKALQSVEKDGKNYYGNESLDGVNYFIAAYADKATSEACVQCHNKHKDSPRDNFKLNEIMGAVVIRIPIN